MKPNQSEITDLSLIALLQKGDKEAFTLIYERHHRVLYLLAFKYLQDEMMVEDIIQNVFLKLWEIRASLSVSISLRNYLYTMTKNMVLNHIRNNKNMVLYNYQVAQTLVDYNDNIVDKIKDKDRLNAFYYALSLLSKNKKRICLLKMADKYTNEEIADEMGLSIHTVKSHYYEALKILRVHLDKLLLFATLVFSFIKLFR